jgi:hypothetical protein
MRRGRNDHEASLGLRSAGTWVGEPGKLLQECGWGHDLEQGKLSAKFLAFGGVLLHQISQVPFVPRNQIRCMDRHRQISVRLVFGVTRQRKGFGWTRNMNRNSLHVPNEDVNALGCQGRIPACEFGTERNISQFREGGVAKKENRLAGQYAIDAPGGGLPAADEGLDEHHGIENDTGRSGGQRWFR